MKQLMQMMKRVFEHVGGHSRTILNNLQIIWMIYTYSMDRNTAVGPFHTTQSAASYLDYNYDYFRTLVKKFRIPRCGPNKNRFAQSDLDAFMADPQCFLEKPTEAKPVNRKILTIPLKEATS